MYTLRKPPPKSAPKEGEELNSFINSFKSDLNDLERLFNRLASLSKEGNVYILQLIQHILQWFKL